MIKNESKEENVKVAEQFDWKETMVARQNQDWVGI